MQDTLFSFFRKTLLVEYFKSLKKAFFPYAKGITSPPGERRRKSGRRINEEMGRKVVTKK